MVRVHETHHRAPTNLIEDDDTRLGIEAVARLRAVGYHVDCDEDFDTDRRPVHDLPLGAPRSPISPSASAKPPLPGMRSAYSPS
ncbi:hypothetical protein [Streptomyces flavidovirens]